MQPDNNKLQSKSLMMIFTIGVTVIVVAVAVIMLLAEVIFNTFTAQIAAGIIAVAAAVFVTRNVMGRILSYITGYNDRLAAMAQKCDLDSPVVKGNFGAEVIQIGNSLEEVMHETNMYVSEISNGLKRIAEGDLSTDITGQWKGSFREIQLTYNSILSDLRSTFSEINNATGQVNTGSQQVANGAQALSQGSTQQAASIEELSAQISDISEKVKTSAEAAKKTAAIVNKTTAQVTLCSEEMSNMLAAIDDINKSSAEIAKIINVIDDIAFQTNILALNAAVEAARAGSAGKGFAVVADEVRNLAAKSAEAANQTTALIQGSISSVAKGSKIAKETAEVLNGIVSGTQEIEKEIRNISGAAETQATAIIQINTGVTQISTVVQNNTATAEESAAASEELSDQSSLLKKMIGHFRFEKSEDSYSSSSYDEPTCTSYSEPSYNDTSYNEISYNEPVRPEPVRSEPAYEELSYGRSDNDDSSVPFEPMDFSSVDLSDRNEIILDDDFINVDSKY